VVPAVSAAAPAIGLKSGAMRLVAAAGRPGLRLKLL
jgi:hypothetical protein